MYIHVLISYLQMDTCVYNLNLIQFVSIVANNSLVLQQERTLTLWIGKTLKFHIMQMMKMETRKSTLGEVIVKAISALPLPCFFMYCTSSFPFGILSMLACIWYKASNIEFLHNIVFREMMIHALAKQH